ncbi:olfactory receptor 14A2-like [Camelus dromedarius]|uniref:olfactory receptor 14A2-like n=1 Tax=Camelus dromedarius TaxID=9838 RepID=UPI0010E85E93
MTGLSAVPVFILRGSSEVPEVQLLSAAVFLLVYLAAILGNISIVAAMSLDPRLHTPSVFSSPPWLMTAAWLQASLVALAWGSRLLFSASHTADAFSLPFCGPKVTDHSRDIPAFMGLACAEVDAHEVAGFAASGCVIMSCFVLTVLSYVCILAMLVQIRSVAGGRPPRGLCTWPPSSCLHAARCGLLSVARTPDCRPPHTHPEPAYLQSEEQGREESPAEALSSGAV